ncbi:bifunctional phosphopantothenoylcysteine decarboxylase/phosphopantothenate--cysteine ligase CoaBC [Aureimonas leprariae]|uniref:Coenzyme A biosynthesis bifunctional protein CoaBC n=1 Tax=Plantimonas leprariae TaxID=2615207 RepID=A0A7V7TYS1_9HYPH|nr:bifunctional phosphopantothenoylcysteine decarboxylase/phosphopantothenate--cysteine ligase CoaBC [Aureimonas leprariae]KAB0683007.1 bifunctional phosphopantothenoylcysteine decarboxylase/phosphopantothenate--cysteine ligase CoaBC [Aureimonas leprariae]
MNLQNKRILLVVGGGIAAYKALDLVRRLKERGATVVPVMTRGAQEFVTPLAVGALSGGHVFIDLFSREDEQDVGHIRLAREADAVVVAPATADRLARLANGLADDLAGAVLLAAKVPVLLAPAMNPAMWAHPATVRNVERLRGDGVRFVGPNAGEMAERGESGLGRMAEPAEIADALEAILAGSRRLAGKRIVVTSGPTHEPIDPVRFVANRSSGRQGHAIAASLAALGAEVTLVSGPVAIPPPTGVRTLAVETALEMLAAVEAELPADAGVFVAAVADWRPAETAGQKLKKLPGEAPPQLGFAENPDILATVGHHRERPKLVVGFAAETQDLLANALAKLDRKGADMIVANDVAVDETGGSVMGGADNAVHIVSRDGIETWARMSKEAVADRLAGVIADRLEETAS